MKTIVDVIRDQFDVPEGYDQLYVRSIEPGKFNDYGFEWPRTPGATLTADKASINTDNNTGCPWVVGDGFCLATTHRGMSSGVFTARTLLVVAVRDKDILGSELDGQKIRVRHALVVACVNGSKLVRRFGAGMDLGRAKLRGANLHGADLYAVDLRHANLRGANLRGAGLRGANLGGAYLDGANLYWADLRGANLSVACLRGADLCLVRLNGADLGGANLSEANLRKACLGDAHIMGANLGGADLRGADLSGANLHGADLRGAKITEEQLQSATR